MQYQAKVWWYYMIRFKRPIEYELSPDTIEKGTHWLSAAAHILICLTQGDKREEIAILM